MSVIAAVKDYVVGTKNKVRTRKLPVVVRVYSGKTCVITQHRRTLVSTTRTQVIVVPQGASLTIASDAFTGDWTITKITLSLDWDILQYFEVTLPGNWAPLLCPDKGCKLTLEASEPGGLLCISRGSWDNY